ncbi:MAG: UDP-2,3-diacylglucosamine diphosphatase [Gammaproteobacteria bacterium]|nr:UDP-2,3-diacylglucosamine diphosphatase [Gammaproteobacteria bacterium]
MTALFVSDLHLTPERPGVTRAFLDFLHHADADALYILGDLFEVWVGDDDDSPLARTLIDALAAAHARGIALYFLHGNRDFTVWRRFARETGARLLGDRELVEIHGRRLLLLHGDTLCTDDQAYQQFRRRIRHPAPRFILCHLPLALRRRIARGWRAASQRHNRNKPEYIMDVNADAVVAEFRASGADAMIHGHTHRPGRHRHAMDGRTVERVVLGDWTETSGWCARLNSAGTLDLVEFPLAATAG